MTEKITIKSISVKKGENDRGEWVNTRITATTGAKWGSFDKSLQYLEEGETIEITELEEKGNNRNILKWHKVESGPELKPNGVPPAKTPQQFDVERRSFESQTAFKGVVDLLVANSDLVPTDVRQAAFSWAKVRLTAPTATTAPERPKEAAADKKAGNTQDAMVNWHFDNVGQLLTACNKQYGMSRSTVLAEAGVNDPNDIADLDTLWQQIVTVHEH